MNLSENILHQRKEVWISAWLACVAPIKTLSLPNAAAEFADKCLQDYDSRFCCDNNFENDDDNEGDKTQTYLDGTPIAK